MWKLGVTEWELTSALDWHSVRGLARLIFLTDGPPPHGQDSAFEPDLVLASHLLLKLHLAIEKPPSTARTTMCRTLAWTLATGQRRRSVELHRQTHRSFGSVIRCTDWQKSSRLSQLSIMTTMDSLAHKSDSSFVSGSFLVT